MDLQRKHKKTPIKELEKAERIKTLYIKNFRRREFNQTL